MRQIEADGWGVLLYLRGQEGRGIGLGAKMHAYALQERGRDTLDANTELGLPVDSRDNPHLEATYPQPAVSRNFPRWKVMALRKFYV